MGEQWDANSDSSLILWDYFALTGTAEVNTQGFLFASQMKACLSLSFLHDRVSNQALAVGTAFCPGPVLAAQQHNPVLPLG